MSTLTRNEKRYLEKMLEMGGGYVLNYSDATYGEFFRRHGVEVHAERFQTYGTSKAKKMRSFWDQEPDALVATVLGDMLDEYEVDCDLEGRQVDASLLEKSRGIVARLSGRDTRGDREGGVEGFLGREFAIPSVRKLPIEDAVVPIVESRLDEAQKALRVGAYLSVVVLCGSILEAVLLGKAHQEPRRFNSAIGSPRSGGNVKRFYDWTLANLIDVASELGVLKVDVQKFSHGLRDFRNYIHPYQQISSGFTPDEHTARVCFQGTQGGARKCGGREVKGVDSDAGRAKRHRAPREADGVGVTSLSSDCMAVDVLAVEYVACDGPIRGAQARVIDFGESCGWTIEGMFVGEFT